LIGAMTTILYFAALREAIGRGEEQIDLMPSDVSVAALAMRLAARGGGYATAFADLSKVRAAVDLEMAALDAPVADATEIAFFPPVTGG
jgi:sulfur-carrier protein